MFYFTVSEIDNIYFDILSSLNKIHLRNITEIAFIGIPFQNLPTKKELRDKTMGKWKTALQKITCLTRHVFISPTKTKVVHVYVTFIAKLFCVLKISRALFNAS